MTQQIFQITPPKNIKDNEVLDQLPTEIREQLGAIRSTGYDLRYSRRDIFFDNGLLQYNPYREDVTVDFGKNE